ncbi:MAG: RDD family protein [Candidatus Natronoplasma sp.]
MNKLGKYRSLDLGSKDSNVRANPLWRVVAFFIDVVLIRLAVEFSAFMLLKAGFISGEWGDVIFGYLREGLAPVRGGAMSLHEIMIITSIQDLMVHLIYSALFLVYFIVLESEYGWGQTIGKKILKMKVLNRDGKDISLKESFLRNITKYPLRLPLIGVFLGLAEFLLLFFYNTRTGDLIADTKVVSTSKKGPFDWFSGE